MALWPSASAGRSQSISTVPASTTVVTVVTGSATAHTKGAWAQLIASTNFRASGLLLWTFQTRSAATDTSVLVDIALGASGSERIVVADWYRGHQEPSSSWTFIPLAIPESSRIAVRLQSAVSSKTMSVGGLIIAGSSFNSGPGCARATTYGVNSATSNTVSLTDIGSAHTKASWTEIVLATTNPIRQLIVVPGCIPATTVINQSDTLIDIGVGASGSEAVLVGDIPCSYTANESVTCPTIPIPVTIPAGTRLSARFQKNPSTGNPPSLQLIGLD